MTTFNLRDERLLAKLVERRDIEFRKIERDENGTPHMIYYPNVAFCPHCVAVDELQLVTLEYDQTTEIGVDEPDDEWLQKVYYCPTCYNWYSDADVDNSDLAIEVECTMEEYAHFQQQQRLNKRYDGKVPASIADYWDKGNMK